MSVEVKIPEFGESITEAVIARWIKNDGSSVQLDEPIAELETDKATVELPSPAAGVLRTKRKEGETVQVGDVIAEIEEGAAAAESAKPARGSGESAGSGTSGLHLVDRRPDAADGGTAAEGEPAAAAGAALSPAARRLVEEHGLDAGAIRGTGRDGRVTKEDVLDFIGSEAVAAGSERGSGDESAAAERKSEAPARLSVVPAKAAPREQRRGAEPPAERPARRAQPQRRPATKDDEPERVPMSMLRRRIAARLVEAQHTAAILTTFNEIDMSAVLEMRARNKERFAEVHGVKLGLMSFFARACVLALADVPEVNAQIDGDEIVYNKRVHLGVATSTDRGLVVPVVRNADLMTLAELEGEIQRLADVARDNQLRIEDLAGGTFTISNGGVFGSLMSTPILNPPQSAILGMHKTEKRPVVVDDEIVIRPMMYVALSYDHRLIDGREAVTFLVRVKERIEDPERLLLDL